MADDSLTVYVPAKDAAIVLLLLAFDITRMERRSTPTRLLLRLLKHKKDGCGGKGSNCIETEIGSRFV